MELPGVEPGWSALPQENSAASVVCGDEPYYRKEVTSTKCDVVSPTSGHGRVVRASTALLFPGVRTRLFAYRSGSESELMRISASYSSPIQGWAW